jgi:hypothetical protein
MAQVRAADGFFGPPSPGTADRRQVQQEEGYASQEDENISPGIAGLTFCCSQFHSSVS